MVSSLKYFKLEEFKCHCGECGSTGAEMSSEFLIALDLLRDICGFPFVITSGYRCSEYNKRVAKSGEDGPHTTGKAVDILVSGENAFKIVQEAFKSRYFKGFGISQKGDWASRFIHLDALSPRIWSY